MVANPRSSSFVAVVAVVLVTQVSLTGTTREPSRVQDTSVLLFSDQEQIPLKTYAEFMRTGMLRLTSGAAKDIPTVDTFRIRQGAPQ